MLTLMGDMLTGLAIIAMFIFIIILLVNWCFEIKRLLLRKPKEQLDEN